MPTDLNYGYKKPNAGESGNIFCPVLEANWELVAEHTHDGVTSPSLGPISVIPGTATAIAANWIASGELYYQDITLPTGFNYDNIIILVKTASGTYIHPTIEKLSNTQFRLFVNDNTIDANLFYK